MRLVHSTEGLCSIMKILEGGLKSPRDSGRFEWAHMDGSDVICFTALEKEAISRDIPTSWGSYHFILKDNWVLSNLGQFREHSEDDKLFLNFARKVGLQPYNVPFPRAWNQVLSLKPIPLEGIDELVIPAAEFKVFNFKMPYGITLRKVERKYD